MWRGGCLQRRTGSLGWGCHCEQVCSTSVFASVPALRAVFGFPVLIISLASGMRAAALYVVKGAAGWWCVESSVRQRLCERFLG
jgi:hypothetical protein